jgi:hypothetical protein
MRNRLTNEITDETKFKANLCKTGYIMKETTRTATLETYCKDFEELQQNVLLDLRDYPELEYLNLTCKNFTLNIEKI